MYRPQFLEECGVLPPSPLSMRLPFTVRKVSHQGVFVALDVAAGERAQVGEFHAFWGYS